MESVYHKDTVTLEDK